MLITGLKKKMGDFSLSVDRLEITKPGIYGIIGPNGSGKSTLAKLAAGLLEPDAGKIDAMGLRPVDITILSRKPYMMDDTVHNNLVYPLRVRRQKPDTDLVKDYLDRMYFSDRGRQKARSLSGGEQQKLAFLRALIFRPKLIIADEAITALDIDSLDYFENLILEEQKKNPVIWIIISHQMPHIRRLCEYVYFMHQGEIEASGSADEIFSRHSNPRLKQYLRVYGSWIPDGSGVPEGNGEQ